MQTHYYCNHFMVHLHANKVLKPFDMGISLTDYQGDAQFSIYFRAFHRNIGINIMIWDWWRIKKNPKEWSYSWKNNG